MKIVKLIDIQIAEGRQREEFDPKAIAELRDSIVMNGLLHPPVIRMGEGGMFLVAGERRMRAIYDAYEMGLTIRYGETALPLGSIPVNIVGELPRLAQMELEYEENVRRVDLSWSEKAKATMLLMNLRALQAEVKQLPAPTIADIAFEIRGSTEGAAAAVTRNEVLINPYLADPDVLAAKTLKDAVKIVKKKEIMQKNIAAAESLSLTILSSRHTLLSGNCLTHLPSLTPAFFDCILTDPPYGMGANEFGDSGQATLGQHTYEDSYDSWRALMKGFIPETIRITKADAHAYIFCDFENFQELKSMMESVGWKVFRTPIVWHKPANFRAPWPTQGPQRKYELCLYAVRGKKEVTKLAPDVVSYSTDTNLGHAAQKPVELYTDLLGRSCSVGQHVIDPFCGTGPIFPAAQALRCIATGIEMSQHFLGIASNRIAQLIAQEKGEML